MIRIVPLAALSVLTFVPVPTHAQVAIADDASMKRAQDILADAVPADGPGATVVMTGTSGTLFAGARGYADVAAGTPIGPDTLLPLGSMTKQFAAATVLLLAEDGKLSQDDTLGKFFPDWPEPGASATVRQLLNHTSGIADFSKVPGWIARNREREFTTAQLIDVIRPLGSKAKPGEEWEYNNGGYVLIGAIVEKVAGRPWHAELRRRILDPQGLAKIVYARDAALPGTVATGYRREGEAYVPVALSNLSISGAAGGLLGTANEVARWNDALHNGRILSPASYAEMTSLARLNDGSTANYGFGLRTGRLRGHPALFHGGSLAGFRADGIYIPDENVFVGVFGNTDAPAADGTDVMLKLAALAVGDPVPDFTAGSADPDEMAPFLGDYRFPGDDTPRIVSERGGKYYIAVREFESEIAPAGGMRFFRVPEKLTWFDFSRQPDGTPTMTLGDVGSAEPRIATRVGDAPAPFALSPEAARRYAGRFQTETLVVEILAESDGALWALAGDNPRVRLRPLSATEFMLEGTPMKIVFEPNGEAIDGFTLHRGARQLHGKRIKP